MSLEEEATDLIEQYRTEARADEGVSPAQAAAEAKALKAVQDSVDRVDKILNSAGSSVNTSKQRLRHTWNPPTEDFEPSVILDKLKKHRQLTPGAQEATDYNLAHAQGPGFLSRDSTGMYALSKLRGPQIEIATLFIDYVINYSLWETTMVGPPPPRPQVIVQAPPGSGKTHTALTVHHEIMRRLNLQESPILYMSQQGSPAANLPGGMTLQSALKLPVSDDKVKRKQNLKNLNPLTATEKQAMKQAYQHIKVILMEEISCLNPEMIGWVSMRFMEIFDSDVDFAGRAVMYLGDPLQLPPPYGNSIFKTIVMKAVGEMPVQSMPAAVKLGCTLFRQASVKKLTAQFRSIDKNHTEFIERITARATSEQPIDYDCINYLKNLCEADVARDPAWKFPTVVVPGNRQRAAINFKQAVRWAKENNTVVLAWRHPLLEGYKGLFTDEELDLMYAMYPDTCGYFVAGLEAYLLENISPPNKAVNGSPVKYVSLLIRDPDERMRLENMINLAEPGQVLWLSEPPVAVNVAIPNTKASSWPADAQLPPSNPDSEVVIPVPATRYAHEVTIGPVLPRYGKSQKVKFKAIKIDLPFAVTFHKVQGRTVDRILIDLSQLPKKLGEITMEHFYVGVSRVRHGDHLRLFPCAGSHRNLDYLLKLKFNLYTRAWLAGVHPDGCRDPDAVRAYYSKATAAKTNK